MSIIFTIAKNTFKETVRDRIFYAILILALISIVGFTLLGSLSLGQDLKIITDFGLAGIYLFSILMAIFLGTSLIRKELEQRTAYIILSQPVSRTQFIVGKFLGLGLTILIANLIMAAVYLPIIWKLGGVFPGVALLAIFMQFFETLIFVALATLLSTITSPIAASIYSVLIFIIGHSLSILTGVANKSNAVVQKIYLVIYYLFPNLEKFNFRLEAAHNLSIPPFLIVFALLYGLIFIILFIMLAALALTAQDV